MVNIVPLDVRAYPRLSCARTNIADFSSLKVAQIVKPLRTIKGVNDFLCNYKYNRIYLYINVLFQHTIVFRESNSIAYL